MMPPTIPRYLAFAALLGGNAALAVGPWFVRMTDSGPIAAGFWRLTLALPLLALLAWRSNQPLRGFSTKLWLAIVAAGLLFALDLASWHIGIATTRIANATLFGNSGSIILMMWGFIMLRRLPRMAESAAIALALAGSALLLGRSAQLDPAALTGDLLCILAGFFYAFYVLLLRDAKATLGHWSLLFYASLAGAPLLLAIALGIDEPLWPTDWTPLLILALLSQVIGQGLLVLCLNRFSPLVIGLALLTQPIVGALAGWLVYNEQVGWIDALGMLAIGAALVLARRNEGQSGDELPTASRNTST